LSNPALEILTIVLLLIANGVFAMAETAIISARKARLQQLANEGNTQARTALELATNPNQFLATVQIGITLVGILAGAFGGATIASNIASSLQDISFLAAYSETIAVGIVVISITYLSLIIGELVPKRLALNNAERIAAMVATPMRLLSMITSPVVRILSFSTDIVIRLLGIKSSSEPTVTPEEIRVLIQQGTKTGIFEETEQDMIESVMSLDDWRVSAVMTPRIQIIGLDVNASVEQIQEKITSVPYSRFPVTAGNLDSILGIVRSKDLLVQSFANQTIDLRTLLHPPLFIPENISVLKALELFKQQGIHLALVTDEYGGIQGMITLNDVLEAIVGTIHSADEPAEPEAKLRDDGSWLVDGLLSIDEFKEIFDIKELPERELDNYQTVGGLIVSWLDSIPIAGQSFEWENFRFEILDMDGRRVDKVLVIPLQGKASGSSKGVIKNGR